MPIPETYSRRQLRLSGKQLDVFVYDRIDKALRIQIVKLWDYALGKPFYYERGNKNGSLCFEKIEELISTEIGVVRLGHESILPYYRLVKFFCERATALQALDIIELSFRLISVMHNDPGRWLVRSEGEITFEDAVSDLNERFLQHGVGYAFVNGGLIRKDNELLHKGVVLPALVLLSECGFDGANDEYRTAHEHYRHGRNKECLSDCLRAFESTMKTICTKRGWAYDAQRDTASALIAICLNEGLLPSYMQSHLGTVRSSLDSAIPTMRNRESGHGAGPERREVPQHYAEYLLYETATTILFLIKAYKALPLI